MSQGNHHIDYQTNIRGPANHHQQQIRRPESWLIRILSSKVVARLAILCVRMFTPLMLLMPRRPQWTVRRKCTQVFLDPASFSHYYTTLGGYRYHYVDEGPKDGPVLFFVHGFPDFWYGWRHQIRYFSQKGYRVIAIDKLGYGETDKPVVSLERTHPYTVKRIAGHIKELLDQLQIQQVVVVGHDWGAIVAGKVASWYPERCRAYISIGNPIRPPMTKPISVENLVQENLAFAYFAAFGRAGCEKYLRRDRNVYIQNFEAGGWHGPLNYYRTLYLNYKDDMGLVGTKLKVPTLLVIVRGDPILTQRYCHNVPKDFIETYEETWVRGGHFILSEDPKGVNGRIEDYLNSLPAAVSQN
ncbi:hypothetical protein DFQ27_000697 [Actinomortierella ambigua]|uniref:AB hydrolase-1 domain-containing protein n=1 Tax=Actinomortierella ambigua TaxID=1343610 RepID=A0A9P6QCF7_9FUNG|nr:hypothetical protein DFQ27_000697 [Actinomortierella ambigua]